MIAESDDCTLNTFLKIKESTFPFAIITNALISLLLLTPLLATPSPTSPSGSSTSAASSAASVTADPYVCGRKCKTNLDLKKHFRERERQKKVARMRSFKGKKRQKYKERFISSNFKYEEAARQLLTPKTGAELRRAGVDVKTVEDNPPGCGLGAQEADAAFDGEEDDFYI